MSRRSARALAVSLLLAAGAFTPPAVSAALAPQNLCDGPFCATVDLTTYDAGAPAQVTSAAGQPTNLRLRFTDTSPSGTDDPARWLAAGIVRLGTSSSKAIVVADPASLPLGSYVAGTAAAAGPCALALDYTTACPAGYGTGRAQSALLGTTVNLTFGIQSITTGAGGAMTATIIVNAPGVTILPTPTTVPVGFSPATANAGPKLTFELRPTLPLSDAVISLNDVTVNLNGLVTEAAAGAVSPASPFLRLPLQCTAYTATLQVNARGAQSVSAPFALTSTGCPAAPTLTSVVPVAGQPRALTFTMGTPAAGVAGRTATLEWVFGDGATAVAGATTTHTYPVANPVTALVTTVDSAGARSTSLQLKVAAGRLRVKQPEGDRITGVLADQDTGNGVAGQQVVAYRCATGSTPVGKCEKLGSATTRSTGAYRIRIPEVTKKGVVLVAHDGTGTTSASVPARFGSQRYLTVLPQPDVTLRVSDRTVRPGATVRLTGKVKPGKKGKTVRLQGFLRGKWRSIGKATISATGRYAASYTVLAPKQDKVKVRALMPGTAATLEATSPVKVIRFIGG